MMKNAVYYIFKKTQEKDSCKTEASKSCFTLSEKKELTDLKSSSAKNFFSKVCAVQLASIIIFLFHVVTRNHYFL